jgi:hypothetical protein
MAANLTKTSPVPILYNRFGQGRVFFQPPDKKTSRGASYQRESRHSNAHRPRSQQEEGQADLEGSTCHAIVFVV